MSAPDFYFAINAMFRHLCDRHGKQALIDYWRCLAREHYASRIARWRSGGPEAVAADWQAHFAQEPGAEVEVVCRADDVELDIRVCPAIKHLREQRRAIVPYFCEHCDHVSGTMAEAAGYRFERTGGMGSCRQRLTRPATIG